MTAAAINRLGIVVFALFALTAPWVLPLFVDEFWVFASIKYGNIIYFAF